MQPVICICRREIRDESIDARSRSAPFRGGRTRVILGKHFDRRHFARRSLFQRSGGRQSETGQLFRLKTFHGTRMLIYADASKKRKEGDAQIERAFSDAPPSMAVSAGSCQYLN